MISTILWGIAVLDEVAVEENGEIVLNHLGGDAKSVGDGGYFVARVSGNEAQDDALHRIKALDVPHVDKLLGGFAFVGSFLGEKIDREILGRLSFRRFWNWRS